MDVLDFSDIDTLREASNRSRCDLCEEYTRTRQLILVREVNSRYCVFCFNYYENTKEQEQEQDGNFYVLYTPRVYSAKLKLQSSQKKKTNTGMWEKMKKYLGKK